MRQLDLFGSFFETPSQENQTGEKEAISKKPEETATIASAVPPSYSRNGLRSERFTSANTSDTNEGSIADGDNPGSTTVPSSLFLSLFDSPLPKEEAEPEIQEIEVTITDTPAEAPTPGELEEPNPEVFQPVIAEAPEISTRADELEISSENLLSEPVVEVKKKVAAPGPKKQQAPELERTGSVIFDDGKIAVKIKNKSPFPAPIVKEKKEKVKKIPQKRGRKSFKEIDAEVDLIEIPEDEVLFQKQYYPISEVAKWFRVNTSLLRFWENEFDVLKPRKNRKGDRLFRPEDVKNLQLIYQLLRQRKYTIEGAKEYIKTNKKKADIQLQLTNTLQKFKSFLLDMKANLQ